MGDSKHCTELMTLYDASYIKRVFFIENKEKSVKVKSLSSQNGKILQMCYIWGGNTGFHNPWMIDPEHYTGCQGRKIQT